MEAVGEALLSAAFESLFGTLASREFLKFALDKQVIKEMENLESKLLVIRAVLDDAEEKQMTEQAVEKWLTKLRDLAYDVEDVLDKFHTEALQRESKSVESRAITSRIQKLRPSCSCFTAMNPIRNMKIGSKLQQLIARFEDIVKEKNDLGLIANAGGGNKKVYEREPTASLVKEPKVYGREKDKEEILKLLIRSQPSDTPYTVIPIIGMGGVGKTTLAQLIYNDGTVQFDYKAWVCVSDDYDILRITKTILQHPDSSEAHDLNSLQVKLKEKLSGKKFLIVLDDVWNEKYEDWTNLRSPFATGAPGSKIIVTTRNEYVSSAMSLAPAYKLKVLSYDECLCLFAQHAVDAENFNSYPHLNAVGQKIVEKCGGLPLAAKTLGGLLRSKQSIREWEAILHSKIWDLPKETSGILPALRLSYHCLPSYLKRCFAYCAVFPKDYEFDENELVLLWMAEGFLQTNIKEKQMLDLGHEYFRDLLSRSFFERSSNNTSRYVMHDLIRYLAQFISGEMCFNLDDRLKGAQTTKSSATTVRHSSLSGYYYVTLQKFKVFSGMKSLRTFLTLPNFMELGNCYLSTKVLQELLPALELLRVVSLAGYTLVELPDSICALKQLRYLNLSDTPLTRLPESLSDLFNLQTLQLRGCKKLVELPTNIGNLIKLHCLDISDTDSLKEMPLQIHKLENLCILPKFIVGKGNGLGIGNLIKLPHLQGHVSITGLHNVVNIQDANLAMLKEKQGLGELALEWIDDFNSSRNEWHELQVLQCLQPHQNLKKLSITSYGGIEFPSWMGDHSFTEMVQLRLCNCRRITSLPLLGKLPGLKYLSIQGMHGVKEVAGEDFPLLETLIFEDMLGWQHWSWSNGPLDEGVAGKFPKLRELRLVNCPKLIRKLPSCLPSLKKLHVEGCQEVVLRSVPDQTSLTTLKLCRIFGLVSLRELLVPALVALEHLEIEACEELAYLWQDEIECNNVEQQPIGLHSLPSLRELGILKCPKLVSFPKGAGLPCSLKFLKVMECESLESLPDGLMTLMNGSENSNQCFLEKLRTAKCPSLKSFPRGKLPATLKFLTIWGCQDLESLPEGITSLSYLEDFHIKDLSLTSIPASEFPTSLKVLQIFNCKVQSLPSLHNLSHLTWLRLDGCPQLETFSDGGLPLPNLSTLYVQNCKKLRSLSIHMDKLMSLEELIIHKCCQLEVISESGLPPNVNKLWIRDCENLRQPPSEWGLCTLTALKFLCIDFTNSCTGDVDCFPHDDSLLLPTWLTHLWIYDHKNLQSMTSGLQKFTSLEVLGIRNCPKLRFLPKEGFPPTLGVLSIRSCPLLGKSCSKEKGVYWPIIAHIPYFEIDD